ncbi:hypothetical protein [Methylomagnum ishizawai]|uniref:hypothetical protein n=1 Tax=Methylomagnum ishizawai TaxID=1760988 RepID=UPI001FE2ABD9|nr:hypothetical protein [Methylomagnum ishizawai]
MAHVHGAAKAAKTAVDHAAMGHGTQRMAATMEHAGHMMDHAGHMMASMPKATATIATGAAMAGGAVAATTTQSGSSFMSILAKHPLVVFGLGVAAGYFAHKYRKEIIATALQASEKSKDFVLHQKENLEDLVAECHEHQDDAAGPAAD